MKKLLAVLFIAVFSASIFSQTLHTDSINVGAIARVDTVLFFKTNAAPLIMFEFDFTQLATYTTQIDVGCSSDGKSFNSYSVTENPITCNAAVYTDTVRGPVYYIKATKVFIWGWTDPAKYKAIKITKGSATGTKRLIYKLTY
jgi:hypothetical protein